MKAYREKHKDDLKKKRKDKYEANKDKYISISKNYGTNHKEEKKEYDKRYRYENKDKIMKYNEELKIRAFETIAKETNMELRCWKCGEDDIEKLSIGHIDNSGKTDRKTNGRGSTFRRKIINGSIDCSNLRIECYNCNNVAFLYGIYPNEIRKNGRKIKNDKYYKLKKDAYEKIANHHNRNIECFICGEKITECLTIGHINNDGCEERKKEGRSTYSLYSRIVKGDRSCEDLQLECWNCNCSKYFYKNKYNGDIKDGR